MKRRQRCKEVLREIEAGREDRIGFDTNKSIQQSRKVGMRKGEETDLMKRNQALNKKGRERVGCLEPVCECVL